MKKAELKPCPFCAGEPTVKRHWIGQRKAEYRIGCEACGYAFPWNTRLRRAEQEWNRRNDKRRSQDEHEAD